jgi:hypothetical protein
VYACTILSVLEDRTGLVHHAKLSVAFLKASPDETFDVDPAEGVAEVPHPASRNVVPMPVNARAPN